MAMIEGQDYFVVLVDFPVCSAGGCIVPNDDGTVTILLNSRLSTEQNRRSFSHELGHLFYEHLYSGISAEQKEKEADRFIPLLCISA